MTSKPVKHVQTRAKNATTHPGYIVKDPANKRRTRAEAKAIRDSEAAEKDSVAAGRLAVVEKIAELEVAQVAEDQERKLNAARPLPRVTKVTGRKFSIHFILRLVDGIFYKLASHLVLSLQAMHLEVPPCMMLMIATMVGALPNLSTTSRERHLMSINLGCECAVLNYLVRLSVLVVW